MNLKMSTNGFCPPKLGCTISVIIGIHGSAYQVPIIKTRCSHVILSSSGLGESLLLWVFQPCLIIQRLREVSMTNRDLSNLTLPVSEHHSLLKSGTLSGLWQKIWSGLSFLSASSLPWLALMSSYQPYSGGSFRLLSRQFMVKPRQLMS